MSRNEKTGLTYVWCLFLNLQGFQTDVPTQASQMITAFPRRLFIYSLPMWRTLWFSKTICFSYEKYSATTFSILLFAGFFSEHTTVTQIRHHCSEWDVLFPASVWPRVSIRDRRAELCLLRWCFTKSEKMCFLNAYRKLISATGICDLLLTGM